MIDLSKIKAVELPEKTVKVNINGTIQEQNIKPLTGDHRLRSWALDYTHDPAQSTHDRVMLTLVNGAGLDAKTALKLISVDWDAAVTLSADVLNFTEEFEKKIAEEKKNAEKNLNTDTSAATLS